MRSILIITVFSLFMVGMDLYAWRGYSICSFGEGKGIPCSSADTGASPC